MKDVEGPIHRDETWKPVVGFEGLYEVSDLGRVRSLDHHLLQNSRWGEQRRIQRGRMLRPKTMGDGYLQVCLYEAGRPTYRAVAHLVYEAYLGPRPAGFHVCHNNGNRTDNRLTNLRADTVSGNHADKVGHGTLVRGSACHNATANEEMVRQIRSEWPAMSYRQIATKHGIGRSAVISIVKRLTWRHV